MNLVDLRLNEFIEELGRATATPGGGSAAALAGSLAASLAGMAAGLSATKKGLEAYAPEMREWGRQAKADAQALLALVDADAAAFDAVLAAIRLPKTDEAEKQARREAMQAATFGAARVPAETLRLCAGVARMVVSLTAHGNPACASDMAAAAYLAAAGAEAAWRNVAINLESLPAHDPDAAALRDAAARDLDEVRRLVAQAVGEA